MKHYILQNFTLYLKKFSYIHHIRRINNNTIEIEFNNQKIFYFDMTKGSSTIYMTNTKQSISKIFNAPFDVILQKRFTNAKIIDIYLRNNDKILNIKVQSRSSYKEQISILQFEFTGKNTNVIILDNDDIIIEALRHIDEYSSSRVVKVGQKLQPLQKPNFTFQNGTIDNIEQFLLDNYTTKQNKIIQNLKKQKISQIEKQIKKINAILKNLDNIDVLKEKVTTYNNEATFILSELYRYKGYEKQQKIKQSNQLFKDSKKAKAKVKNQHIEQQNLKQKLDFYHRLIDTIQKATTVEEIEFYFPKKEKNQTITKKTNPYQLFLYEGYRIMLGRDERENIYLLQHSRASDFWFHLKDMASSHVIVPTKKKTLPSNIIKQAAMICAKFSTNSSGTFEVDYTQRRNVKIQNRANVLYNPYSTIVVKI